MDFSGMHDHWHAMLGKTIGGSFDAREKWTTYARQE
jgi:hypothetical protein